MFRKRRRPTPHFKISSPYNPIAGEQANLRQEGTSPFCAMMQIAAADTHENHVICRGFDPRILRFIDYAAGNADKPGISVAKPFGKRTTNTYEIGQIYPALLPTQGNADFTDFRQVTYVPPSPSSVDWRVGQNPGVVVGGLDGGQPSNLSDAINILYDHNGKVINWILLDSPGGSSNGKTIEFTIESIATAATGHYTGKVVATVTIETAPCGQEDLIGTSVDVVDHSGCVFDLPEEDLIGVWGWATERVALSTQEGEPSGTKTPCHWAADDRCCTASEGGSGG